MKEIQTTYPEMLAVVRDMGAKMNREREKLFSDAANDVARWASDNPEAVKDMVAEYKETSALWGAISRLCDYYEAHVGKSRNCEQEEAFCLDVDDAIAAIRAAEFRRGNDRYCAGCASRDVEIEQLTIGMENLESTLASRWVKK